MGQALLGRLGGGLGGLLLRSAWRSFQTRRNLAMNCAVVMSQTLQRIPMCALTSSSVGS
jgi:hypothetical protein